MTDTHQKMLNAHPTTPHTLNCGKRTCEDHFSGDLLSREFFAKGRQNFSEIRREIISIKNLFLSFSNNKPLFLIQNNVSNMAILNHGNFYYQRIIAKLSTRGFNNLNTTHIKRNEKFYPRG